MALYAVLRHGNVYCLDARYFYRGEPKVINEHIMAHLKENAVDYRTYSQNGQKYSEPVQKFEFLTEEDLKRLSAPAGPVGLQVEEIEGPAIPVIPAEPLTVESDNPEDHKEPISAKESDVYEDENSEDTDEDSSETDGENVESDEESEDNLQTF